MPASLMNPVTFEPERRVCDEEKRPTPSQRTQFMNENIERALHAPAAAVIARIALTFPFWSSGASKLMHFEAGVAEMARAVLEPAVMFNLAAIVVQLMGSLLIIVGYRVWLGSGALGVFTGLTVLLVHRF
ncbi:MAG TPA: DoxX family protein [Croceibacterium sp.]|nr:DoxX family protein [Croceibacterium sp.]